MEIVIDTNTGVEVIKVGMDGEDEHFEVAQTGGYAGCDVFIGNHPLTWETLDDLKEAIKIAEIRWRNNGS